MKYRKVISIFLVSILCFSAVGVSFAGADKIIDAKMDVKLEEIVNEYYTDEKIPGITVSDENKTRLAYLELYKDSFGNVDELFNPYVDEDISGFFVNYQVFANTPVVIEKFYNNIDTSTKEGVLLKEYYKDFLKKYPLKFIRSGVVTFITIENKEQLFEEFSEEDMINLTEIAKINDCARKPRISLFGMELNEETIKAQIEAEYFNDEILKGINISSSNLQDIVVSTVYDVYYDGIFEDNPEVIADLNLYMIDEDIKYPNGRQNPIAYDWLIAPQSVEEKEEILLKIEKSRDEKLLSELKVFYEKYPTVYVTSSFWTFITVENKESFSFEFEQNEEMLKKVNLVYNYGRTYDITDPIRVLQYYSNVGYISKNLSLDSMIELGYDLNNDGKIDIVDAIMALKQV